MLQFVNSDSHKMLVTRLRRITFLITSLLISILLEKMFNSQSKRTLFEHIQLSLSLTTLISIIVGGSILFILFVGLMFMASDHGIFIIYMTLLKLFELIPSLIDLFNLFIIYDNKIQLVNKQVEESIYPSTRLIFSLIFVLIRLSMNVNIIRQKIDCKWKRQMMIIFDLLLFILINITLIRHSNFNIFRIGRKIILGFLLFQLNDVFSNESFWTNLMKWNEDIRLDPNSTIPSKFFYSILNGLKIKMEFSYSKMINLILFIRWLISLFIICLFVIYTFQPIISIENDGLFFIKNILFLLKYYTLILMVCIFILSIIRWDTFEGQNQLNLHGISKFCTGLHLLSSTLLTKTCQVCFDDKDLNEFDMNSTNNCNHMSRSICNSCLFHHVQQVFEITFTDDIYCPEVECRVKIDYDTVKNILFFNSDEKLFERYDRYVVHRQLEQMDEFIWCANPSCNTGQLNDGGKLNNIVTCFNCHEKTCFTHKIKWHQGLTCAEYDERIDPDDETSQRWIMENSKKCPNCPYQIEKSDGCDHMKCIKCHHEFCWSCLADFQPIRQDGNHRHNSNCKHYASYDGQ